MRNDERLRTIYEVMAPYIVRSERNWRDYLAFASRFHKQSFDNVLLVYAQDHPCHQKTVGWRRQKPDLPSKRDCRLRLQQRPPYA